MLKLQFTVYMVKKLLKQEMNCNLLFLMLKIISKSKLEFTNVLINILTNLCYLLKLH